MSLDKISSFLGISGISANMPSTSSAAPTNSVFGFAADDSISLSGSEAINAFGALNVASLDDEAAAVEGAENAEAAADRP